MLVNLHKAGKRFNREWIFREVEYSFRSGSKTAVLGPNGSGKSTFIQMVSGALLPSEGSVEWLHSNGSIQAEMVFHLVSMAAPYMEVPEELTLEELIGFHFSFKPVMNGMSCKELVEISGLSHASEKSVRHFSSGMKQRVRLLLACCSDVPLLLLDEPCSNLDNEGVAWYEELVRRFSHGKTILVGSNHTEREFGFCDERIEIVQWK